MDFLLLITTVATFLETSLLLTKTRQKPLLASYQKRKVYVDTSALMDPRLVAVAQTGFIGDDLIVPRSVIHELQLLADGKDHDKRIRARAGLDAVRELERVVHFNLTILDDPLDRTLVDNRLLDLARANRGLILTNDFNLQKVAATDHIDVLNLNELALVLRNEYLPGERTRVKLIAPGSGTNQGVAYLKDGTMVVVDQAGKLIGDEVEVEFVRLNQTASGSMMFARLVSPASKTPQKSDQKSIPKLVQRSPQKSPSSSTQNTIQKLARKASSNASSRIPRKTASKSSQKPRTSKPSRVPRQKS